MRVELEDVLGYSVSRETFARLDRFVDFVRAEAEQQNLVSRTTLDVVWPRHILDSAQLIRFPTRADSSWLDIGSGAGFPGMVVAILAPVRMTLVEPRRLRAAFLDRCVADLGLTNTSVQCTKIENMDGRFDCITARAVASLDKLFAMAIHLSHSGTNWLLPKGRSAQLELDEARRAWQGSFRLEASLTDPGASVVVATGVRRRTRPGTGGRQ